MIKEPLVSVVVAYFNSDAYFKDLLISIEDQTIQDLEVIIIDDKSKPESSRKLVEIVKLHPRISIQIHTNKINLGVAKSRNRGFALAKGRYITFIDADDLMCGRYSLEQRINFLKQNKLFSGVGGYAFKIDKDNKILSNIPDRTIEFFRDGVMHPENLRTIYASNILKNSMESASALFFAAGSCLFRRVDLVQFLFDPVYETEDDIEWLLRILKKKKIKLEMIPFHCRRVHQEQYHLRTPAKTTERIMSLCREILG